METSELMVWSCMLGGLLTLATVALADVLMNRSVASWRGLVFVLMLGSCAMLLTSLPALWFPELSASVLLTLKASMGPLCGALSLIYLGLWLGAAAEDRMVYYSLAWGATVLVGAAVLLAFWALNYEGSNPEQVIKVAAGFSGAAMLLALGASVRAHVLGDELARWMVVACLFLAGMTMGLYTYTLHPTWFGWQGMALTAFCTVGHFLLTTALAVRRNRQNRRLLRLAGLAQGADPATGLPTGSVLLSKVDDTFWRAARQQGQCTVVCLHLHNLYELGESAGHRVDQQILTSITARIRRAVGFRCVVGLYHPRCFVVVISGIKHEELVERTVLRLRMVLSKPLSVVGLDEAFHTFMPRYGMGVVTVRAASADPVAVVDEAERRSWENAGSTPPAPATTF
ncbi:diguanylate cyclase domain-containing protein [Rhodoferax sp.]|uniref:diguanylate cyclase domain-containing protein n=1 Tax=Rhodoferax sp. TaxID=50421 RepID=UPI002ACDFAF3|nr:diguanylate cyclase [Rhodoferax sp.]MDZ7919713.1 diguanylate cyclase [Rhodoferax sp.]